MNSCTSYAFINLIAPCFSGSGSDGYLSETSVVPTISRTVLDQKVVPELTIAKSDLVDKDGKVITTNMETDANQQIPEKQRSAPLAAVSLDDFVRSKNNLHFRFTWEFSSPLQGHAFANGIP